MTKKNLEVPHAESLGAAGLLQEILDSLQVQGVTRTLYNDYDDRLMPDSQIGKVFLEYDADVKAKQCHYVFLDDGRVHFVTGEVVECELSWKTGLENIRKTLCDKLGELDPSFHDIRRQLEVSRFV